MELKERIPYHKPYPLEHDELKDLGKEIKEVLKSGDITDGKYVRLLEEMIKEIYDVEYVIATSNCTMGLFLCFQYEVFPNEVIHMPNFTWISPYLCIPNTKQFYDIDKQTWLMKHWPKGGSDYIFPTHTFGSIVEIEREYHVIYDGAHALGSVINKFGDATVLSLAPTKLVTSCEGGLVLTNEQHLADLVRFRKSRCARMSEVHALIGLYTLKHLSEILEWKKRVYHYYKSYIPGVFQKVPHDSNFNTIGFLNIENLKIPDHITKKQYYEPIFEMELLPNSFEVYKKMVCLPSYFGAPYVQIVEDIKEANEL